MKYKIIIPIIIFMIFPISDFDKNRVWSFVTFPDDHNSKEVMSTTMITVVNHSLHTSKEECLQCHPMIFPSHMLSTPLRISEDLQLDQEGKITCITCHDCSTNSCNLIRNKTELCRICHDCDTGMSCILGVAHMGNSEKYMNREPKTCLTCHDGVIGPPKNARGVMVNKRYRNNGKFKDLSHSEIVLVNGKVACISCHNPYQINDTKLKIPHNNNELCANCHKIR